MDLPRLTAPVPPAPSLGLLAGAVRRGGTTTAPRAGAGRAPGGGALSWVDGLISGYDLDGPRVRMGLVWFVLAVAAAFLGMVPTAVLFGLVAAVAGLQVSAAWRKARWVPNPLVAGVGALAMALAAMAGIALVGVVALALVALALVAAAASPKRTRRRVPVLAAASTTVRAGFYVGLVAASAVFISRTDSGALITLVVLVSAFEVGDYLVGTGAANPVEGPVAGIAAVVVLTFALAVFELPPFEAGSAWVFGGLVAALAPLGRFGAAVLVPGPDARVPALRRLDSYLIVTPVWAWMLWGYLA